MSDNVPITPGAGVTIATDDVAGVQFQRVKLDVGGDGVSLPVTSSNPMPVGGTVAVSNFPADAGLTNAQLRAGPVPVAGSFELTAPVVVANFPTSQTLTNAQLRAAPVAVDLGGTVPVSLAAVPLATGAASAAKQDVGNASLASVDAKLPALAGGALPVTGPATDAQLRATALPVSLTGGPTATGQATGNTALASIDTKTPALVGGAVPVAGPLTDAQMRAAAVPVSATALPLPAGAATEATGAAMSAKLPASVGAKPAAGSLSVTPGTDSVFTVAQAPAVLAPASGTVTTGGSAQNAAAANPSRRGFWFQNLSSGDLWINTMTAAGASQPSLKLLAGAYYESPPGGAGTGAISVFGATTGQAFSGREW